MVSYFDIAHAPAGRIALYGGTFDPVHWGHLHVARRVMEELDADRVVFMPAGQPPHKPKGVGASAAERWKMLELALDGEEGLCLSDYEIGQETRCYTADTLTRLRQENPELEVVFIIGGDSLIRITDWYRPDIILSLARIAAVTRPGVEEDALRAKADSLRREYGARVDLVLCEGVDISSTMVREAARQGADVSAWVPGPVAEMIREKQLYREE